MRPIGLAASGSLLLVSMAGTALADSSPATLAAWKEQRLEFTYEGRASRYSCEGLSEKVRAMLLDLGARRDLSLEPSGCAHVDGLRPDAGNPRLRIVFFAPVPVALGRGAPRTHGATLARFESFTIVGTALRNMGVGDCELVEEFVRRILPKLTVRNLTEEIRCSPERPALSHFLVQGQVLRPAAGS
jgi:hypothetical protein